MEIECKYSSNLLMKDLYIDRFNFSRNKEIESTALPLAISRKVERQEDTSARIELTCTLGNETTGIKLDIIMVAYFDIDKAIEDDDEKDKLLNLNAVAIMFPFMRSQISILTSQPGLQPVIIPPINVQTIMNEQIW